MPDPPEASKKICNSCGHNLEVNEKGLCTYCGHVEPTYKIDLNWSGTGKISGDMIEERWIDNRYYQAFLIALIIVPLIFTLLIQSWVPIIIGVIANVISYYIGSRVRYKEKTIRHF